MWNFVVWSSTDVRMSRICKCTSLHAEIKQHTAEVECPKSFGRR